MATLNLLCHPWSATDVVRAIRVSVSWSADDVLAFTFSIDGDLARIRVPPPRPPCVAHQLWEHTCVEAFVAVDGAPGYHELNFAPSGEWAGYAFGAYREIAGLADPGLAPGISVRTAPDRLDLDAHIALVRLSPKYPRAPLHLGLSAVIETSDGTLSYWALRHPVGKPDFHHTDAFALRLEPGGPR
jgi:hypothetical protein